MPFDTRMSVITLPGWLIADIVSYSRSFALMVPPVVKGCYIQLDNRTKWNEHDNQLIEIANQPIDMQKEYKCAINVQILEGVDSLVPLLAYLKKDRTTTPTTPPPPPSTTTTTLYDETTLDIESIKSESVELRNILVSFYTKQSLLKLLSNQSFAMLDTDGDGYLRDSDIVHGFESIGQPKTTTVLLLHNTMHMCDVSHCHQLDRKDMLRVCLAALVFDSSSDDCDSINAFQMHSLAIRYLGDSVESIDAANSLFAELLATTSSQAVGEGRDYVTRADIIAKAFTRAEIEAVVT